MVKRCSFGICNSDSKYPERLAGGVEFVPFPKPKTNYQKCVRWIKLCGRPHEQLNLSKINSNRYVCTKHFVNSSWPTKEYPDPVSADPYTPNPTPKAQRPSPSKRRRLTFQTTTSAGMQFEGNQTAKSANLETGGENDKENNSPNINNPCVHNVESSSQTCSMWVDPMDVMCLAAENNALRQEKEWAVQGLAQAALNVIELKRQSTVCIEEKRSPSFDIEQVIENTKLIKYYTGFSKQAFLNIYHFLVPNENSEIVEYVGKGQLKEVKTVSLKNQLFLTLCKLRNDFDLVDIGQRFAISQHAAGVIFNTWIHYMYLRFGEISTWPDRDVIKQHMPDNYAADFPNTFAILDCTELKTQKPASLKVQSQTYSDYKSSNTLKGLVAVDPRGSVLYTSMLFSGSVSDKELFEKGGLKDQLKQLLEIDYLKLGDGLMADKGFHIEESVVEIGLLLNIPPFAATGTQMSERDVFVTRKIAKHRVHVERAIRRIKSFKILSNQFQVVHMTTINQIWNVCAFLTNFMPLCIKEN